jgi:hypothetical protein
MEIQFTPDTCEKFNAQFVLFTKSYWDDEIKKVEHGPLWRHEKCTQNVGRKLERGSPLGRVRCRR